MKVVHPGHPPKPLILRCEPKASLEGRTLPMQRTAGACLEARRLRSSHLSMRRFVMAHSFEGSRA